MMFHLVFNDVSFLYPGARSDLFNNLNLDFAPGWTGIVGPNGSGKTTLLFLATGRLTPDSGSIQVPRTISYCPQRTDDPPARLAEFLAGPDPEAYLIASQLQVGMDWQDGWPHLSHGERKRAQIAVALWENPEILAIDEPTNHIDREARTLLETALRRYTGIGLMVSHDRQLLDSLVGQCLFVDPPGAELFKGNYSDAHGERERERESLRAERERLDRTYRQLDREVKRRREKASRSHRMRSKRNIPIKDHDARFKINVARLHGEDGDAGRATKQLEGRMKHLDAKREALDLRPEGNLGIWIQSETSPNRTILDLPSDKLPLDSLRQLDIPRLTIERSSRIALTGPNGTGKSTLIRFILEQSTIPEDRLIYLPQELSIEKSRNILKEVLRLPNKERGRIMQIVNNLGSRPERLLESELLSPGEVRKLLLALGIRRNPWFIVLDEPTNHLDLPSIECLEAALSDCPCAMLLVSHDQSFLESLATTRWNICSHDDPILEIT